MVFHEWQWERAIPPDEDGGIRMGKVTAG